MDRLLGRGNHFWKCLYLSELIDNPMTACDDFHLQEDHQKYKIGFTNIVSRTTRSSDCLTKHEIQSGAQVLRNKIIEFSPKIAVFNGIGMHWELIIDLFCFLNYIFL